MHAIAWRTLSASPRIPARQACRVIAGVRRPLPSNSRKFHPSATSYQAPEDPSTSNSPQEGKSVQDVASSEATDEPTKAEGEEPESILTNGDNPPAPRRERKTRTDYRSAAVNRLYRNNKKLMEVVALPPVVLPEWVAERNVILVDELEDRITQRREAKPSGDSTHENLSWKQIIQNEKNKWLSNVVQNAAQGNAESIDENLLKAQEQRQDEKMESNDVQSHPEPTTKERAIEEDFLKNRIHKSDGDWADVEKIRQINQLLVGKEEFWQNYSKYEGRDETTGKIENDSAGMHKEVEEFLPGSQFVEILATLQADLAIEAPKVEDPSNVSKPTTLLSYPKDGGLYFLDEVVEQAACRLDADLLRLDPQDLAEIVGSHIGENVAWSSKKPTATLSYEAHDCAGRMEAIEPPSELDEFKFDDDNEDMDKPLPRPLPLPLPIPLPKLDSLVRAARAARRTLSSLTPPTSSLFSPSSSSSSRHPAFGIGIVSELQLPGGESNSSQSSRDPWSPSNTEQRNADKANTVLEALLDAASSKRKAKLGALAADGNVKVASSLLVQICDYKELTFVPAGSSLISKLEEAVRKRWQTGEKIAIVGTSSSEHHLNDLTKADMQTLQSSPGSNGRYRTIPIVTSHKEDGDRLEQDERAHIRAVNLRNVEQMFLKLTGSSALALPLTNLPSNIDKDIDTDLEEAVWRHNTVFRVATLMAGQWDREQTTLRYEFINAVKLMNHSDDARINWTKDEKKRLEEDEVAENARKESEDTGASGRKGKDRIKALKDQCNFHEKRLLNGVVYPEDIKTTFSDVRVPPDTVEALKTLTSLSLIRPEAFSYGVLATDKIPGLLLYGPPGTGKTMLAKAVAKESGATVLDVSGADLFNLYVGEGEKNVRALFSLAKKLTPCVVFIDEADAIFGSRGGSSSKRSSHRELINQFLREWDGMNDMSAFIMVATNRPFDLDDAVLRRLPRRLLVDLPSEKDREAILKIHLQNEVLDDTVSLSKLAHDTPFYSGSDLKNVSVAAALACVREENEEAAKHTGSEPYVYPVKRTLSKRHFDKALEEISASISEDMSTLTAVRKFDEKYGDRKGRRKKRAQLGFGGLIDTDKDSEAGRVRKIEVEV